MEKTRKKKAKTRTDGGEKDGRSKETLKRGSWHMLGELPILQAADLARPWGRYIYSIDKSVSTRSIIPLKEFVSFLVFVGICMQVPPHLPTDIYELKKNQWMQGQIE